MHACQILTFDSKDSKEKITKICDDWANANCDHLEVGTGYHGLDPITWTNRIFDDEKSAMEYLDKTFGRYDETAVRFRRFPAIKPSKKITDLHERLVAAKARLFDLDNTDHYAGVSVKTIKCKTCGSTLATSYCGNTFHNNCPVCRSDLRPASKLERIAKAKQTVSDIEKTIREEEIKARNKVRDKSVLCWAVACEVHC